ncbi:hypothetical protein L6251_02705 [Candidatus Parcubacteria bacterium]|nr:hypothetical protein [Patescibacteria group bacterium]MCG2699300.1 hypothetical protein [Candidatus Parcubacteria bacterium]
MEKLWIVLAILFGISFLVKKMIAKDMEFRKEVNNTRVIDDPKELVRMGYNIVICMIAYCIYDNKKVVSECVSLWGKYNPHIIK